MKEIQEHIVRTLNIKDADTLVFERIEKTLTQVPNIPQFIGYIEKNMFHIDLQYINGYQKFIKLTKRYTDGLVKIQSKEALSHVPSRAKELADKVKNVSSTYDDNQYARIFLNRNTKELNYRSFKGYFAKQDIKTLSIIGSLKRCIYLQRSTSGVDALEENLKSILESMAIKAVSKNHIANKQRDVLKIVSSACEVVR